jgi:hypothetical protein
LFKLNYFYATGGTGHWTWAHSHEPLTHAFWGANRTGNSDDCSVLVLQSNAFWWEATSCSGHDIQQHAVVAPICQHDSIAASATSEEAPSPKPTLFECPPGWREFDNHCYIEQTSELYWYDAEASCSSLGGHLASIHSRAEYDFILDLLPGYFFIWIGGIRGAADASEWTWSDGSVWDYEAWYEENSNPDFRCVLSSGSSGWYNHYCDFNQNAYVCKI